MVKVVGVCRFLFGMFIKGTMGLKDGMCVYIPEWNEQHHKFTLPREDNDRAIELFRAKEDSMMRLSLGLGQII